MTDESDAADAISDRDRSRALAGICLGFALVILDANVLNVAAPVLRTELGADAEGLLWIVDGYTLVFAALLLSAGALGDRLGVRRIFLAGLAVFATTSVACSLARSAPELIVARVGQGLGAALLAPTSLALLRTLYPDEGRRAHALGMWAAVSGIAFALGPLCGGALVTYAGWRSIFLLNLPFGVGASALVFVYAPAEQGGPTTATKDAGCPAFDGVGQIIAAAALGSLTFALVTSARAGWASAPVLTGFVMAVTTAAMFLALERRKPDEHRLLSAAALRSSALRAGLLAGAAFNFGLYGTLFVLTLHLQVAQHVSPVLTGAAFLPLTALHAVISAVLTGRVTAARGPRAPLVAGLALCAIGTAVLAAATLSAGRDGGPGHVALLAGLALFGVGSGLTTTPMTALVLANLPGHSVGVGSGVLNASRQLGGLIGVALLGSLTVVHPAGPSLAAALAIAVATMAGAALYGHRHAMTTGRY